ncbi:uncharacterized protein N7469_002304 [Penicillium citrinum]|uniref:FAD-binding PCMH-type domain-containing protein n=1 Tax=Penicillium citrinum TaxID=5077 RepID=A0A9W9TU28_PENCI|nr:uncharacterized protein N7469_002304 [Penicillium citrinum]KAJ5240713.1 hypothetical protein N7469_002304 [Penicillium citrinum]
MHFLTQNRTFQLQETLKDTRATVVTPEDEGYPELISRWSEASEKEAGAVVIVTTSKEVALVTAFATRHHVPLVVHAGGYSTSSASSTHGGIVIDLSAMHHVVVDSASRTVAIQGGATWAEVDEATAREGLAVVGCTSSAVGVGGTTLGGGFGWLTGRHGLIIDNLISVKLVLADGSIRNTSMSENPDLFWALRGAGQEFGVATEFVMRAHRQNSPVFGGFLYFSMDSLANIVGFANSFDQRASGDEALFFGFTTRPLTLASTAIFTLLFYNGPQSAAEDFFAPLLKLNPIQNNTQEMSYREMNNLLRQVAASGARRRVTGASVTLPLKIELMEDIGQEFDRVMQTYPRVEGSTIVFELIPYARVNEVPTDATAYANRGPYYNVAIMFRWRDHELDSKMASLGRSFIRKLGRETGVASIVGSGVGVYANYAGPEFSAKELFGDNLPRLQELKKRYDPQNMFRKWHNLHVSGETCYDL